LTNCAEAFRRHCRLLPSSGQGGEVAAPSSSWPPTSPSVAIPGTPAWRDEQEAGAGGGGGGSSSALSSAASSSSSSSYSSSSSPSSSCALPPRGGQHQGGHDHDPGSPRRGVPNGAVHTSRTPAPMSSTSNTRTPRSCLSPGSSCVDGRTGTYNTLCSSVERFDPLTGQWSAVAPISTNRCAFGLAAMNGKLYMRWAGRMIPTR
jgi:hypothetical protein